MVRGEAQGTWSVLQLVIIEDDEYRFPPGLLVFFQACENLKSYVCGDGPGVKYPFLNYPMYEKVRNGLAIGQQANLVFDRLKKICPKPVSNS
jgi:hypothetical protein